MWCVIIKKENKTAMKIISRNASTIVIKDWALVSYFLGLFCLGAGSVWLYTMYSHGFNILKVEVNNLSAALFVVVGLFIILKQEITTITFDKLAENISIIRKGLFTAATENYQFSNLSQIILQEKISRSSKGGSTTSYDIQLVLKDGNLVSLVKNEAKTSFASSKKKKYLAIAKELSEFAGVNYKDSSMPSFGQAMELLKQVIANKNPNSNLDNNGEKNYEQR